MSTARWPSSTVSRSARRSSTGPAASGDLDRGAGDDRAALGAALGVADPEVGLAGLQTATCPGAGAEAKVISAVSAKPRPCRLQRAGRRATPASAAVARRGRPAPPRCGRAPPRGRPGASVSSIRAVAGTQMSAQTPKSSASASSSGCGRIEGRQPHRQHQRCRRSRSTSSRSARRSPAAAIRRRPRRGCREPDQSKTGGMPALPGARQ